MARGASGGSDIVLDIGPEETVAVMGMRGTGKTTLMQRELLDPMRPNVTVWDPLEQYPLDVAYRPPLMDDREDFDRLAGAVFTSRKPWTLFIEEAEQVWPEGPNLLPWSKQLVLMGRNYEQRFVVNLRAPQALSKHVLRQCDHMFIFKLDGASLDYMTTWVGSHNRAELRSMLSWVKDPREPGGGRFFHYHDGVLTECDPLKLK